MTNLITRWRGQARHKLCGLALPLVIWLCSRGAAMPQDPPPRTLAELDKWYRTPPTGSNAAAFYLKGNSILQITEADLASPDLPWVGKAKAPAPGQPVQVAMKGAMAWIVSRNDAAIAQFRDASRDEESRYPIDLKKGAREPVRHLNGHLVGGLNEANRFLALCALSYGEAGQSQEAAEAVVMNLGLARSLEAEPILVSQHRRAEWLCTALESLEQVMNRGTLRPDDLQRLKEIGRASC